MGQEAVFVVLLYAECWLGTLAAGGSAGVSAWRCHLLQMGWVQKLCLRVGGGGEGRGICVPGFLPFSHFPWSECILLGEYLLPLRFCVVSCGWHLWQISETSVVLGQQ